MLRINMLGEFSLIYGDREVNEESNRSKKIWTLLEYLITFRDREISQNEMFEVLWPDDNVEDPANTLKTLLHRARNTLSQLGIEDDKQLIYYRRGTYRWNPSIDYTVDVEQYEQLCTLAFSSRNEEDRLDLFLHAINLYKGDFLPKSSLELWAVPIHTYYRSQYIKIVHEVLSMLQRAGRFDEIIKVCWKAVSIDPYDEDLHYALIQSLVATGAQRTALQHYEYVTDLYFNQFGVTPSKELTDLYKEIMKTSKSLELNLNVIKEGLREAELKKSAFFCEYVFFKDIYRLEARAAARTGQAMHIALITISGAGGAVLKQKQVVVTMERLSEVISETLRKSDIYTRYSVTQYLILLPSASYENGNAVMSRIVSTYKSRHAKSNVVLQYKLLPLDP